MTLEGIDVSQWQGAIDWNAVAAAGVQYAWTKVSEGVGFEDPMWAANSGPLAAPGPIIPGGYHFARPDLGNAPEAEAEWFWTTLTKRVNPTGWLLSLDLEVGSGPLGDWRDRFCGHLSQLAQGYVPGWYDFWNQIETHALNYPTPYWGWFAWPDSNGPLPSTNFSISFQQYGLRAVAGIGGQVDADRFFGSRDQLQALTLGGIPAGPSRGGEDPMTQGQLEEMVDNWYLTLTGHSVPTDDDRQHWVGLINPDGSNARLVRDEFAATDEAQAYLKLLANVRAGIVPTGPQGPKGDQGPQGIPGPAVTDDHIASIALGSVSTATKPPTPSA